MLDNLGTLNGILFEQLRSLVSVDMTDPELVDQEIEKSRAVAQLAGVAIDNANTALKVVRQRDEMMGDSRNLPKMLGA